MPGSRWRGRVASNPFGTSVAVAGIVIGLIGAVAGTAASRGMTEALRGSADVVSHVWGALLASGGVLKLAGLLASRSTLEVPGLWMLGGGFGFMSLTALAGAGSRGFAGAFLMAAVAVGCVAKARLIMRRALEVTAQGDRDGRQ